MSVPRAVVWRPNRWTTVLLGFPDRALAQFTLTATAAQTQVPPVTDGVVADGEWNGTSLAAAFVQFELGAESLAVSN